MQTKVCVYDAAVSYGGKTLQVKRNLHTLMLRCSWCLAKELLQGGNWGSCRANDGKERYLVDLNTHEMPRCAALVSWLHAQLQQWHSKAGRLASAAGVTQQQQSTAPAYHTLRRAAQCH